LLTSRRGADDPRAEDVTAELTALGARVEIAACDVADPDALADLLARIDTEAPLRGVVHCAGVLADAAVTELTADRLTHVLRPKTDGAAHLHRLTAGRPLDLFLLLSSAAGVLGSPGQANYAAANAFLDQLAHHRRALGLPALSLPAPPPPPPPPPTPPPTAAPSPCPPCPPPSAPARTRDWPPRTPTWAAWPPTATAPSPRNRAGTSSDWPCAAPPPTWSPR